MRNLLTLLLVNCFLIASSQSVLHIDSIRIGNQNLLLSEMNLDGPIKVVTSGNLSGGAIVVKNPESTKNTGINLINDINNRLIIFSGGSNRPYEYQENAVGMYSMIENSSQQISYFVLGNNDHAAPIIFIQNNEKVVEIDSEGNLELANPNSGLIMTSPNGSKFKIRVDDEGNLVTSPANIIRTNEVNSQSDIKIFPNPTSGELKIEIIDPTIQKLNVEIYDMSGNLIFGRSYITNSISVETSELKNGTYLIKLKNGNGELIKSEKFIKQ